MKILYRFSDSKNNKNRPNWFDKRLILKQFLHRFDLPENEIFVFADNVCDDTIDFLNSIIREPNKHVVRISLGNANSFLYTCNFAMQQFNDDNEIIYFAEDDYLYTKNANKIINEGIRCLNADYVTGYDHPDKYINGNEGGNPQIKENGEVSVVRSTSSSHWKYTNSTTITFAVKLGTLKKDYHLFHKYSYNMEAPQDYSLFCELIWYHNRKLASSIPGCATHCEIEHLSPIISWNDVFNLHH